MGRLRSVIDIGSNSVRLVIYAGPARAPAAIVNEKVLCGLGRGLRATGALTEEAMGSALRTLERFRTLLDAFDDVETDAVATSAVRDAANQKDFLQAAADRGVNVRVISGADEARYAALGVMSADPNADGLVGDLGGGSLELIKLHKHAGPDPRALSSLVLGPLRLLSDGVSRDRKALKRHIDETLAPVFAEKDLAAETLYMVGGAWRNLARIEIQVRDYPLSILHHFTMRRDEALSLCDLVASQSLESLSRIPEISRRRLETLPTAAVVLERLILASGVKRLSVSAAGLREGVLYDNLSPEKRALDPLAEGAQEFGRRLSPNLAFAKAAARFTAPLFSDETPEEARLREAACAMVDIGAFLHPDHRDFPSYTNILHAPLTGIDHPGRVFVALAIFHRYAGRREPPEPAASERILPTDERRRAMLLGLTLRLAGSVAPKSGKSLDGCRLERTSDELIFSLEPEVRPLFGEVEERRLSTLAGELGLDPVVRTIDETAARRTG